MIRIGVLLYIFLQINVFAHTNTKCAQVMLTINNRADGTVEAIDYEGQRHAWTNRDIHDLKKIYKESEIDLTNLKGEKVLDAGCGGGAFVEYLSANHIDVKGIDLHLGERQFKNPIFTQGDMRNTHYKDGEFGIIFSTASLFLSPMSEQVKFKALTELKRILKIGGRIYLGDVWDLDEISGIISKIPGLKITKHYQGYLGEVCWIEKIK